MDPNLTLLGIAVLNALTALMVWRTGLRTKKIETATNGINAALVKATGEAAHAAGKDEARIEGEMKAAAVAEGKLQA